MVHGPRVNRKDLTCPDMLNEDMWTQQLGGVTPRGAFMSRQILTGRYKSSFDAPSLLGLRAETSWR